MSKNQDCCKKAIDGEGHIDRDSQDVDFAMVIVRRMLGVPKMVPEIRLSSTCVSRAHFLQWDPQIFVPGPIWATVSFPSDRDITDSDIFLFTAVLFFVDNKMRHGEPEHRVWRELCHAWDTTFRLAPGEVRPNRAERRYGFLFGHQKWPEFALDIAISGESGRFLCSGEEDWLKDCLYHYTSNLDSLEKLHDVRGSMVTEGPRWWRRAEDGKFEWMPKRFWGANSR